MDVFVGIDLGSTTSKAVVVSEEQQVLGRGLTNTRSNYKVASDIAREESLHNARFSHLLALMEDRGYPTARHSALYSDLDTNFRYEGYLQRLSALEEECQRTRAAAPELGLPREAVTEVFALLRKDAYHTFDTQARNDTSKFFRDVAGTAYADAAETVATARRRRLRTLHHPLRPLHRARRKPDARAPLRRVPGLGLRADPRGPPRRVGRKRPGAVARGGGARSRLAGAEHTGHGGHGVRAPTPALPGGEHPVGDTLPWPRSAPRLPQDAHHPRHRRPGYEGHPGGRRGRRHLLPHERPVRRGVRPLPGIHRRRTLHVREGPRAPGVQGRQVHPHLLHVHRLRGRRTSRPPQPGGEEGKHPGGPPPRHRPEGLLAPGALGRREGAVHLHGRRGEKRGGGPVHQRDDAQELR